jgi:hypothetical protein
MEAAMTNDTGLGRWFLLLGLSLGICACGSGSGSGANGTNAGAPCDPSTDSDPVEPAASDLSTILIGHWTGKMSGETDYELFMRADGTCDWTVDYWYSDDPPTQHLGGTWAVFGAKDQPSFDAPWILRLSPDSKDEYNTASTYRIVTITSDGFTVYDDIEGNDSFMEMQKAP